MYKKILVPLDGSEFSECILEHVKAIATGCQVPEVVLLRVVEPVREIYWMGEDWRRDAEVKTKAMAQDYLSKLADKLKQEGMAVNFAVVDGKPVGEILNYASNNQVDPISMSTHGESGISRFALGSVTDRVIRHSTAPLLLVSPPGCRNILV